MKPVRGTSFVRGILIVTALVAMGACDGSKPVRSGASTSTAPRATSTAPRTSSAPSGTGSKPNESFIGHWFVHGSQLDIESNTSGVYTNNCGGAVCLETDNLSLSLAPSGKRMTFTITKITFTDETGKAIPNPDPADSHGVGDSTYLEFIAPHLMKRTFIHTTLPDIEQHNNPYWCGEGLAPSLGHLCGA